MVAAGPEKKALIEMIPLKVTILAASAVLTIGLGSMSAYAQGKFQALPGPPCQVSSRGGGNSVACRDLILGSSNTVGTQHTLIREIASPSASVKAIYSTTETLTLQYTCAPSQQISVIGAQADPEIGPTATSSPGDTFPCTGKPENATLTWYPSVSVGSHMVESIMVLSDGSFIIGQDTIWVTRPVTLADVATVNAGSGTATTHGARP